MNKRFFNQQNLTRRLRLLPVLFAMLLMPIGAWAAYAHGGQSLTFYYTGDSGPNYYYSGSGDNTVTEWNVSSDAFYQSSSYLYSGFSYVKLTYVNPLKGPLTGFTLEGSINNMSNHVNLKVYRLATLTATEGTLIGSITIGGTDVPSYTYTAEDGVSQEFNNQYIQLVLEPSGSESTPTFTTGQITKITLTVSGTDYGISVGNYRVTSNNATDIFGDGKASFTAASGNTPATLTLNGVTIGTSTANSSIISNLEDEQLTINLLGTNKLFGFINDKSNSGTLAFTGTGSLAISCQNGGAVVRNYNNVTIADGLYIQTNTPGTHWENYDCYRGGGSMVSEMTITTSGYYPIWVLSSDGVYYIQVSDANKDHVLGDNITTVTYNSTDEQLILNGFVCSTTDGEPAIYLGDQEEFKIYLSGDNTISSGGTGYGVYFNREVAILTVSTDKNQPGTLTLGQPTSGNYNLASIPDDCVIYEDGLGFYNNTISTVWPHLVIGDTQIMGTMDKVLNDDKISFDAGTNTLTLSGATIEGDTFEPDIDVYVKDLIVAISGTNTVNGRFYGHYTLNGDNVGTIHFTKAEGATSPSSITISGDTGDSGPVYEFSQCTWDNDLYLTEAKTAGGDNVPRVYYGSSRFTNGNTIPKTVKISTEPSGVMLWIGETAVTSANASNIFAGNGYLDGKVSFTVEDNKNVLILDGANLMEYPIVSDLTNLTIRFKDDCSLYTITSNKTNATLRFEKAADADDGTQLTGSGLGGSPWSGFGGGVTFGGNLAYFTNSDTWYINNLSSPKISVENSAVSFGVGFGNNIIPITNANDFNFFYTLQYEDKNQQSVTTFTQYDPQNPLTINMASVLKVKARYKYAEDYSDVSIGKYFDSTENPFKLVFGGSAKALTLSPAIEEGDGIKISSVTEGANATFDATTQKFTPVSTGTSNRTVTLTYTGEGGEYEEGNTVILNESFNVQVDVEPVAPTISPNGGPLAYNETITLSLPEGCDADIKYKWGNGDEQAYTAPIAVQNGILTAWAVRTEDPTNLLSGEVTATFTKLLNPELSFSVIENVVRMGTTEDAPTLKYSANMTAAPTVTWSSDHPEIATVDETTGVVTPVAVSATKATITATFAGDDTYAPATASYKVEVAKGMNYLSVKYKDKDIPLAKVRVTKGKTLNIKENYNLICPAELVSDLTWTPDASTIATAADGVVSGVSCGNTRIVVAFAGNDNYAADTYEFYVDVAPLAPTIELEAGTYLSTHAPITITKENIANTAITYTWDDITGNNNATWKNYTDDGVAFQGGTLSARVEFTTNEGDVILSDTASVAYTVIIDPELKYMQGATAVTTAEWTLGKDDNTALPVLQNTHSVAVTYESSNTDVATVAADGTVTVVGIGTATITATSAATSEYAAGEASYTLTVKRQLNVSFSASNTWATYCGTENLSTPKGLKAYQVTAVEGATVTISEIGYIPANTAVLLQNVSNNNVWTNIAASAYTGATSTFENNKLIGTASAVDVSTITGGTVYILVNNMFRRSTSGSIPANRGYLVVEPSAVNAGNAPQLSISIGDENTTGVQTLNVERGTLNDDSWYTIDGDASVYLGSMGCRRDY